MEEKKMFHLIITDISNTENLSYLQVERIVYTWDRGKDDYMEQYCPHCDKKITMM